jgi:hypothetical protein
MWKSRCANSKTVVLKLVVGAGLSLNGLLRSRVGMTICAIRRGSHERLILEPRRLAPGDANVSRRGAWGRDKGTERNRLAAMLPRISSTGTNPLPCSCRGSADYGLAPRTQAANGKRAKANPHRALRFVALLDPGYGLENRRSGNAPCSQTMGEHHVCKPVFHGTIDRRREYSVRSSRSNIKRYLSRTRSNNNLSRSKGLPL